MPRYQLCGPHIVSKILDGEAIIINLDNGVYYSLDGVGAAVWDALVAGRDTTTVSELIRQTYECNGQPIESDIEALLAQLLEEKLFHAEMGAATATEQATSQPSGDRPPYTRPQLQIYRDMAELLALDPPVPGFLDAVGPPRA
jgi:hypothetical protein